MATLNPYVVVSFVNCRDHSSTNLQKKWALNLNVVHYFSRHCIFISFLIALNKSFIFIQFLIFFCTGLHSASVPGILSLDVNPNNTNKILTGGADKCATVFNKDDEQVFNVFRLDRSLKSAKILFYWKRVVFRCQSFQPIHRTRLLNLLIKTI